jgi:small subunit ribosomal protein S27Ae
MKHKATKMWEAMKVEDGKIVRVKKTCKRCGDGVYMAEHKEKDGKTRSYCGKCQYTEWN